MEWKAFDLRPGTPPEGLPRQDTAEQKLGQPLAGHAGNAAREAGLTMRRAGITPYTRLAMEAGEYAKSQGLFDPYHLVLFKAYWEEGKNLGDSAVLLEEAEHTGLDAGGLRTVLEERSLAGEVESQVRYAHEAGIQGIPAFIVDNRYLFTGAQPYEFFRKVMHQVMEERGQPHS